MKIHIISPEASRDLLEIIDYFANRNIVSITSGTGFISAIALPASMIIILSHDATW
jgi:hypothetical protein